MYHRRVGTGARHSRWPGATLASKVTLPQVVGVATLLFVVSIVAISLSRSGPAPTEKPVAPILKKLPEENTEQPPEAVGDESYPESDPDPDRNAVDPNPNDDVDVKQDQDQDHDQEQDQEQDQTLEENIVDKQAEQAVAPIGEQKVTQKTEYPLHPKDRETDIIVIMMASFRDDDCHLSVLSAFENAAYPDRLRWAIFQQHDPQQDIDCDNFSSVCPGDHPACSRRHLLNIKRVMYTEAKGPTWGRAMHDEMIGDDEVYALQIDAHMLFVPQWDLLSIDMFLALDNEYAVITTYVRDVKQSMDPETGVGKDDNIVIVCNTQFRGAHGMPRHSTGGIVRNPMPKGVCPMIPVWCAGLSFSAAHRVRDVKNDPYTPQIFDGEEFLMTAKLWTHGYDFYAPASDIVFHPYNRHVGKKPQPLFQQVDPAETSRTAAKSAQRIRHVLNMPPKRNDHPDLTDIEKYQVGHARTLEAFYAQRHINIANLSVETICPSVTQGRYHKDFHPKELKRYVPLVHGAAEKAKSTDDS